MHTRWESQSLESRTPASQAASCHKIRNGSVYTQARRDELEPDVLILSHAAASASCRQNMMLQRKRESYLDYLSTMIKNKMGLVRKTHAARIIQVTFLKKVLSRWTSSTTASNSLSVL